MLEDASRAHSLRFTALRYFNVAGADPLGRTGQSTLKATHLIKVASEAALGRRNFLSVFGNDYDTPDGTGIRDYIHVCDLVDAHYLALKRLQRGGGSLVMNVGYGLGFSVRQVIDAVKEVSGVDFEVRSEPRRAGDAAEIVADNAKILTELNWEPQFDDLKIIVSHALEWERKLKQKNSHVAVA